MARLLFVGETNVCRSVLAEHLFRQATAGRSVYPFTEIESAGLGAVPGSPPSPATIAAGRRNGVDLSRHRSRRLDRSLLFSASLVLVMEEEQRRQVLELGRGESSRRALQQGWWKIALLGSADIPDPETGVFDDAGVALCAAMIRGHVEMLADGLAQGLEDEVNERMGR
jgi:protein-tyrosine phosphatase